MRARYPFMSLTENLANLLNVRQNDNETLIEYLEHFEQDKSIIKSQLGEKILDTFMESYPKYDKKSKDEKKALKAAGFEAWMVTICSEDQTSQFTVN